MNRWEYKTSIVKATYDTSGRGSYATTSYTTQTMSEKDLMAMGDQGWELVNIVTLVYGSAGQQSTTGIEYIFKRPKH